MSDTVSTNNTSKYFLNVFAVPMISEKSEEVHLSNKFQKYQSLTNLMKGSLSNIEENYILE